MLSHTPLPTSTIVLIMSDGEQESFEIPPSTHSAFESTVVPISPAPTPTACFTTTIDQLADPSLPPCAEVVYSPLPPQPYSVPNIGPLTWMLCTYVIVSVILLGCLFCSGQIDWRLNVSPSHQTSRALCSISLMLHSLTLSQTDMDVIDRRISSNIQRERQRELERALDTTILTSGGDSQQASTRSRRRNIRGRTTARPPVAAPPGLGDTDTTQGASAASPQPRPSTQADSRASMASSWLQRTFNPAVGQGSSNRLAAEAAYYGLSSSRRQGRSSGGPYELESL